MTYPPGRKDAVLERAAGAEGATRLFAVEAAASEEIGGRDAVGIAWACEDQ